jgi:hypothetical protein
MDLNVNYEIVTGGVAQKVEQLLCEFPALQA